MKGTLVLLLAFSCVITSVKSQSIRRLVVGFERNIDVFKYTRSGRNYNEVTDRMSSSAYSVNLGYNYLFPNKKWSVELGLTYRKINLQATNYYQYVMVTSLTNGYVYAALVNGDYQAVSKSWGMYAESDRLVHKGKYLQGRVGLNSAWLFGESFESGYNFVRPYNADVSIHPLITSESRKWFLSSTYLEAFYRLNFTSVLKARPYIFDFSLKTGIGANVYSDWDQFKRYVWIGAGAEIGIRLKYHEHN